MPPRDGFTFTYFVTVADIDRSADFYEKVFGGRILSRGDSKGASGHIQVANTWLNRARQISEAASRWLSESDFRSQEPRLSLFYGVTGTATLQIAVGQPDTAEFRAFEGCG
jgi:hypothetical protein